MTLPLEKQYALIINPSAGGGRALKMLPEVERQLDARHMIFRVEKTRSVEHGIDLALDAIEGREIPVVMSGDGLVGAVGGAMAGADWPLGLIPAGRGNDLARGLGIPTDPAEAVNCLDQGFQRQIDVGEANGERFLGIASVGFDSEANRRANEAKVFTGTLVYAYAALRTLLTWKPERFALVEGGVQSRYTGYTIAVANNGYYGGGMNVAPDAELSDGRLDVVVIGDAPKLRFLMDLPKVFRGTHVKNEEIEAWQTSAIEIRASKPLVVYADGDPLTKLPATVRVLPSALSMIVPGDGS